MNRSGVTLVFALIAVLSLLPLAAPARGAAPSDFTSASSSISSAYVAVSSAQQSGGNVTGLVANLNAALGLYSKAQAENGANPVAASADLQNATLLAQTVAAQAPAVGQAGASARQAQQFLSAGSAVAIVAVAALLYVYGERVYHRLWLRLYSGYLVRKVG